VHERGEISRAAAPCKAEASLRTAESAQNEMIERKLARTGDKQGNEAGKVNERHFAVAFPDQRSAVDGKESNRHGDDERDGGQTRGQADDKQHGAQNLGENDEIEAHGRPHPERIGESLRHPGIFLHLGPAMEQKHGKTEPDTEDQKPEILEKFPPGT